MARIRTIKPEFFTSEDVVSLTPLARLLYIALWCEADREGRLDWRLGTLKMRYFPADECDIAELAQELLAAGMVVVYEASGKKYAEIPSFKTHQVINNRESESTRPPRVEVACKRVQGEGKGREGKGREGKGKEGKEISGEPQCASPQASAFSIPLVDGTEAEITEKQISEWAAAYPAVDVGLQIRQMRAWCNANPQRKKTARGVNQFATSWLAKEQNSGRVSAAGGKGYHASSREAPHKFAGASAAIYEGVFE